MAVSVFSSYYGWVINSENGSVYQIIKKGAKWIKVSSNPLLKNVFCLHFLIGVKVGRVIKRNIYYKRSRYNMEKGSI